MFCLLTKGDIPIDIKWSINNRPVINNENGLTVVKMSARLSSLSIESISSKHRGVFKCIATNAAGSSEYSTELMVNGTLLYFTLLLIYPMKNPQKSNIPINRLKYVKKHKV